MRASLVYLKSLALSGTDNVIVPCQTGNEYVALRLSVRYAAVAGTSGISVTALLSNDGGSTFPTAITDANLTVAPAANVVGSGFAEILSNRQGGSDLTETPTHIKFVFTNLDGTNAAIVALEVEQDRDTV